MTPVLYASAWNLRLNEPLADEPFLDERDAADRFADGSGALTVVDGRRTEVRTPEWFIEIGSGPRPTRIDVQLLDSTGSVYLRADFRPQEGRLFCDRIVSWVYPEHADLLRFNEAEAVTTSTFEPDGSGALEIRDKTVPGPGIVMPAHDIPTGAHWVDFPAFGEWDSLLESVGHLTRRRQLAADHSGGSGRRVHASGDSITGRRAPSIAASRTLDALAKSGQADRFIAAAERQPAAVTPQVLLAALSNTKPDERYRVAGWILDRGVVASEVTVRGQGALQMLFGQARHDAGKTEELARRLVDAGASPAIRDRAGASALGELLIMRVPEDEKKGLYELLLADTAVDVDQPNAAGVSPREAADKLPGREYVRSLIAARDR